MSYLLTTEGAHLDLRCRQIAATGVAYDAASLFIDQFSTETRHCARDVADVLWKDTID